MRISACPLLLALFALVSSVPGTAGDTIQIRFAGRLAAEVTTTPGAQQKSRTLRQSPQIVNLRPRVATPQPGIPEVKATSDRNRVPLGDLVTFTLTPASVVLNPRYTVTIFFGDRQQARIRKPRIDHLYTTAGTFTYSILVKAVEPLTVPTVKLSANPTPVETNGLVKFTAELSQSDPEMKYRFVFADGSDSGWQDRSEATHSYRRPATYQAYVDIGLGNVGSIGRVGGSPRRAVDVISSPRTTVAVRLTADQVAVQAKDEVTFVAQVNSPQPNIEYRFEFGDRSKASEWQPSPRIRHVYSSAGIYPAIVNVRIVNNRSGQQTATSNPLSIQVASLPVTLGVDLIAVPRSVPMRFPVYFKATAKPANSRIQYRFNFGDGSPPATWQDSPEETHIYLLAGSYPAFVEISQTRNGPTAVASSAPKQITVSQVIEPPGGPTPTPTATPADSPKTSPTVIEATSPSPGPTAGPSDSPSPSSTQSPSPSGSPSPGPTAWPSVSPSPIPPSQPGFSDPWWWLLLLAPPILYGGYKGWKYFLAPGATLEPHADPGTSALETEGGPLAINFQMELDPNINDGQFAVDTTEASLIKSERKSDG